jgi:polysaccharide biosynthesis transport protein
MGDGFDFRYYLFVAQRRFMHFLAPALATLVLGTAIVLSLPRIYNSSAKILVESQQINELNNKPLASSFATERIQKIQQRVMTRANLLEMSDKFRLFEDRKNMSRTDIVDLMRSRITFEMLDLAGGARPKQGEKVALAFAVGFDHESATAAANVANELVTVVLEEDISTTKKSSEENLKFVDRELENLKRELAELDEKISAFKIENSAQLPEKLAFNMQLIDKQEAEIVSIDRAEVDGRSKKRLLEIEGKVKSAGRFGTANDNTGGLDFLERQLETMRSEYNQKLGLLSKNHPTMRTLSRQISSLMEEVERKKIEVSAAVPLSSEDPKLPIELKLLAQQAEAIDDQITLNGKRKAELAKSVDALRDIVARTPEIGAQLDSMLRSRQALQDSVDAFNIRLQEARMRVRIVDEQEAERFDVIEPPVVPSEPVRPKRSQLMLAALAASLGIGGATAFGAEFLDNTIRRGKDITHKLNSRLIVSIPYIKTRTEVRRNRGKAGLYFLGALAVLAVLLLLTHLFYERLDILYLSMLTRFGF